MARITQRRKDELIKRAVEHREADRLAQGDYWRGDLDKPHGCAIACLAVPVSRFPRRYVPGFELRPILRDRFALPVDLVVALDDIFEGLSLRTARLWPERFARALPVGVDLAENEPPEGFDSFISDYDDGPSAAVRSHRVIRWLESLERA